MEFLHEYLIDEHTWVAVGFFMFLLVAAKYVYPPIVGALDGRTAKIKQEIDEAQKIKEEAQSFYAEAQRKLQEADRTAAEIIERARFETKQIADEAEKEIEAEIERKMKLAEEKIARAESNAIETVRTRAVEAAIAAAEQVISKELSAEKKAKSMLEKSIDVISKKVA